MAASTTERNTRQRPPLGRTRSIPVAASTKLLAGTMVAINASNLLVAVTAATGLVGAGVLKETADNSAGLASAIRAHVHTGVFGPFGNSASADEIALNDVGKTCYGVDNQTVALTDGSASRSAVGTVFDVDAEGVWVEFS